MTPYYQTIVIGGGQAGLASAYHLRQAKSRFVVLDDGSEIGESWLRRWDSLRLFTPVRYSSLPGLAFPGDAYALPTKNDVANYFKKYASTFSLPVQLNSRVTSLDAAGRGYEVRTSGSTLTADTVIVATGAYHRPFVPELARGLHPEIIQVHSGAYRSPAHLPAGDILVVGAGNSGAQIAIELNASGHRVWLSGRDTGSIPRRLLGRDIYDWLWWRVMRPSVESRLGRRLMKGRLFAGDPLVGLSRDDLVRPGLDRVGRTVGVSDGRPMLDDGRVLAVAAVVWCTGFRPDFSWIRLPICDASGYPRHRRGMVGEAPGLAFVGLRYQYRIGSSLLGGVHEDAAHVVRQIGSPNPRRPR